MKKAFLLFLLAITCCLILIGCGKDKTIDKSDTTKDVSSKEKKENTTPSAPTATETPKNKQQNIPICFVGNSLIDYGCQSNFLTDIAAGYGRKISVDKITWGGARLSVYAAGGKGRKHIKPFKN